MAYSQFGSKITLFFRISCIILYIFNSLLFDYYMFICKFAISFDKTTTMKAKRLLTLCIFLLFISVNAITANFFCRIHNLAEANGLLEAHMSNAIQDRYGFMWFATWNGLVRYDGKNYYTFKPVQCSGGTISSNRIFNIKRTGSDNLWCLSSDNKLYLFNTRSNSFFNIHKKTALIQGKNVKKLIPLNKGITWVIFKDNSALRIIDSTPFQNYQYVKAKTKLLSWSNEINNVACDSTGREWILTDKAAFIFGSHANIKGKFKFVVSHAQKTWLITESGKVVRYSKGKYFVLCKNAYKEKIRYTIFANDRLIIAGDNGVVSIDDANGQIHTLSTTPTDYLYKDRKNRLWTFGKSNSVELINIKDVSRNVLTTAFRPCKELMKNPQLIYENAYGQIVLKPEQGELSYYDEQQKALRPCIFYEDNTSKPFEPKEMRKFIVDHNKNLWIFQKHEAFCISFHPNLFVLKNNATRQECRMLGIDSWGKLWTSDRSMALCLQQDDGPCYIKSNGEISSAFSSFSNQPAYSYMQDADGRVWIGTKGDGLYILTYNHNMYDVEHFIHDSHLSGSLCSDSIYTMFQDKRKRIWLGTYGSGVFMAKQQNGKWIFSKCRNIPADTKARCFFEPKDDTMLIGTTTGLLSVDTRDERNLKCYINAFRKESWGLKGNDIMMITSCCGKIYACVFGSGISEIEGNNYLTSKLHFKTYPISSDATADQIKTAISDGKNVWIISDQSITRFTPRDKSLMTFDRSCFTEQVKFSEAKPVTRNGTITVGTLSGTLSFRNDITEKYKDLKRLAFTGIQYTNDMNIRPLNDIDSLIISPAERSFSLYVSSLDYGGNTHTLYRYRMDGYSDGWNYMSENQHAANFNNITPGNYTLIIETAGKDGKWGTARRIIPVVVKPKFIETSLFKFLVTILIVGGILFLVYAVIYLSRIRHSLQKRYSLLMTVDELTADIRHEEKIILKENADKKFLEDNIRFLENNISKDGLSVEDFAKHLGMSRTAYYNRMKEITKLSPIEFIRQIRIKKAMQLIDNGERSVTDVAYRTGFNDPKYFSRCFKAEIGISPSAYIKTKDDETLA